MMAINFLELQDSVLGKIFDLFQSASVDAPLAHFAIQRMASELASPAFLIQATNALAQRQFLRQVTTDPTEYVITPEGILHIESLRTANTNNGQDSVVPDVEQASTPRTAMPLESEVLRRAVRVHAAEELNHKFGEKVADEVARSKAAWCADLSITPNHFVYGPYERLDSFGQYTAWFKIKVADTTSDEDFLLLDISGVADAKKTLQGTSFERPNQYELFTLPFLYKQHGQLEYRVSNTVKCQNKAWVDWVAITEGIGIRDVPVAGGTVELDHNSAPHKKAIEAIENVEDLVRGNNEYEDSDDKDQRLSELAAGKRLLKGKQVNPATVKVLLGSTLLYLADKFAGAPIGEAAQIAWKLVKSLVGL